MSRFIVALLVLVAGPVHADFIQCSSAILHSSPTMEAVAFLRGLPPRFNLGQCQIQLQVCNSENPQPSNDTVIGDMMVTDRYGQSFYVLLDFGSPTPLAREIIFGGQHMLHYEFLAHIPNPEDGRYDNNRLEMVKGKDPSQLVSLDLGIYTSKLRQRFPYLAAGQSYWVNCQ